MRRNAVETLLGAVVLLVVCIFVYFAYNTAQVKTTAGYHIEARFFKIGGLTTGSDVRVNGIKVGTVKNVFLDPKTFDAVIQMSIMPEINLPTDTVASIGSEGIIGDKYVRITPGSNNDIIANKGSISQTKDFRSLEDQIGEIIFLATSVSDK